MKEDYQEINVKKKNWLKWLIGIILLLFIIITILLPPVFSRLILSPALEESFRQVTSNQYRIHFDDLNWNLLGRKVSLNNISVVPIQDYSDSTDQFFIQLDELSFKKIRYRRLINGNIELGNLNIEGVKIKKLEILNKTNINKNQFSVNFIKSISIDEINLNIDSILILNEADSVLSVSGGNITINQLQWDSIYQNPKMNIPHIGKLTSFFDAFVFKSENKLLRLNNFKISENRLSHINMLFEDIQFENIKTGNSFKVLWPGLTIDSVEKSYHDGIWAFSANKLSLNNDSLFYKQSTKGKPEPQNIVNTIKTIAKDMGIELYVNSIESKSKYLHIEQQLYDAEINGYQININKFSLSEKKTDVSQFFISMGNSEFEVLNTKDKIYFEKLDFDLVSLKLKDLEFKPLTGQFEFISKGVELRNIDWEKIINKKELYLKYIFLYRPYFKLNEHPNSNNTIITSPMDVGIDLFEIEEGNIKIVPENIVINSFNLKLDSINTTKNRTIHLDSLFKRMLLSSESVQVGKKDAAIYLDINAAIFDSKKGLFLAKSVDFGRQNASGYFEIQSTNMKLNGLKWKSFYRDRSNLYMDSLISEGLSINGIIPEDTPQSRSNYLGFDRIGFGFIKLPKIDIDYHLPNHSKILLKKVEITADSIFYTNSNKKPLNFSNIVIKSDYTSLSHNFDSLKISSSGWGYLSDNNKWYSNNISIVNSYSNNADKTNLDLQIDIPEVSITGLDPYDYLVDKKISLETIIVEKPIFSVNGERNKKATNLSTKNWQYELRDIVERFVYIDLNDIQINNAKLKLKNQYLGRRDEINVENIDVNIRDFFIDYQRFDEWNRFLFSDYFELGFKNYFHSINNGHYLIDIEKGALNSQNKSLIFNDISFLSLADQSRARLNLEVGKFSLHDFYLNETSYLPELEIGSINMNMPEIQLLSTINTSNNDNKISFDSVFLYQGFKNYLNAIELHELAIDSGNLRLDIKNKSHQFHGIKLRWTGVRIDSLNQIFTNKKFIYADNLSLTLPNYSWISKDRLYRYEFDSIYLNSAEKVLSVDSLKVISRYDRNTFSANLKFQKDQIDAIFPKINMSNIDYRDAVLRKRLSAEKINILNPEIRIYKDKTIEVDTSVIKPMPALQLSNLGFYLKIDTVITQNGYIQYEEYSGLMDKPGKVYFENIKLRLTGLSNDQDFINYGGSFRVLAIAKMMGKSDVSVTAAFPLNSNNQKFTAMASMNHMNAEDLNPLIQPLTLLSAKKGEINQMQMSVKGNNNYAYGEMLLKYEDLKVDVMNKKLKESGLATFVANSFMIRKNNKNFFFPRKGPIYYERIKYRSFVHYLAHFAIIGAKTSIGVDKRKTQKKIDEIVEQEKK